MSEIKIDSSTVDLVAKVNQLENENYKITRDSRLRENFFLSGSALLNVFLIWLVFFHFPIDNYLWSSNASAVCQARQLDKPYINPQMAVNEAVNATIGIYSYDFLNWRSQITAVAVYHFTPDYRKQFMIAFGDSIGLKMVIDNNYVVSATQLDGRPAQIKSEGIKGGNWYWKIQVPLQVTYMAGRKAEFNKILAEVTVMQVDPSTINPSGLAVDYLETAPLLN